MVTRDDPRYGKLQFLFWKKLTPEQRISVVTQDMPILPLGTTSPRWLSHALEVARKRNELAQLWDAVNFHLGEHVENPFREGIERCNQKL